MRDDLQQNQEDIPRKAIKVTDVEDISRYRHLSGFLRPVEKVLLIAIPFSGIAYVAEIHLYLGKLFMPQQYIAIFLGLILACIFLGVPPYRKASTNRVPWYDIVLAGLSLSIAVFISVVYPTYMAWGITWLGPEYVVFGALQILLIVEACRRVVGLVFTGIGLAVVFYTHFTYLFPVPFYGKGAPWDEMVLYFSMDSSGILGAPLQITCGMIFAFILFGEFLSSVGGGTLLTDFAVGTVGKYRGGPAKVSVVASGLFGTISGSVVANVMVDGWFTIPLMVKTGYKPHVAAAIEAAASTGGQIMPPVMGITAFLIAEFLAIPYRTVALAAAIPACLYYFALFVQVDLEAAKAGIKGVYVPGFNVWTILKKSWIFFGPLAVLIYTLFIIDLAESRSALSAVIAVFVLSFLSKATRKGFKGWLSTLEKSGRSLLMIGACTALAGIIIGGVFNTGLGTIFSFIMLKMGHENLFFILLITGAVCIVLGMSMATAAIYMILAVLVAPALVQLEILPLAAHLFIFYMGMTAFLTPPVCFGAYAAASIIGSDPMKTGLAASRLGVAAYVVGFVFVYNPALILHGTVQDIILITTQTCVGIYFLSVALVGYIFRRTGVVKRALLFVGGLSVLIPPGMRMPIESWILDIGGLALGLLILFWEYWKYREDRLVKAELDLGKPRSEFLNNPQG